MISLFPLSTKGIMCSYACMLQTIDTTKDSFINRMMARNSDFITLATEKKINLKQFKNLNVTLIADAQFFHFLVLLKNYDGRRLKQKIEFLCRQFCSHLAHVELILNFLNKSLRFCLTFQLSSLAFLYQ